MARRPRKVSRRKAQGSGFKGSGFRLFKVQSAVLAAFKVQASRVQASGSGSGRRALGRLQVVGAGARAVTAQGSGLQTKADKARQWTFYEAKQPIDNFIARRPFYRSIVLPVDHFIAPNGRFIKANKRFYQAKAARRPFYRP